MIIQVAFEHFRNYFALHLPYDTCVKQGQRPLVLQKVAQREEVNATRSVQTKLHTLTGAGAVSSGLSEEEEESLTAGKFEKNSAGVIFLIYLYSLCYIIVCFL